jgi:hypothetical protein
MEILTTGRMTLGAGRTVTDTVGAVLNSRIT